MRYTIEKDLVYCDGKPTSVKAFYTKKEICEAYHWSKDLMRKNLLELKSHIYKSRRDRFGRDVFVTTKRVFSPLDMCEIFDFFGLP